VTALLAQQSKKHWKTWDRRRIRRSLADPVGQPLGAVPLITAAPPGARPIAIAPRFDLIYSCSGAGSAL
jgi:hypothetical protein